MRDKSDLSDAVNDWLVKHLRKSDFADLTHDDCLALARVIAAHLPPGEGEGKHTKGPWRIAEDNLGCKNIEQDNEDDSGIFAIGYTHGRAIEDEDLANARLIAASPDLFRLARKYAAIDDAAAELVRRVEGGE